MNMNNYNGYYDHNKPHKYNYDSKTISIGL